MNVTIQIPSPRPITRGLSSPRRNLISTRPLSPRTRVQQIRKLPSFDTRSLLANPNLEYAQPAYILEQKLHLSPEVDALRKEVSLLRENYQLLLNSFQESKKDNNGDVDGSSQNSDDDDMYDEIAQHELSKKLSHYQAEYDELENRISTYNKTLTEKTEMDLNNCVTGQKQLQYQLQNEIESALKLTEERSDLLLEKKSNDFTDLIDKNDQKIAKLIQLLEDLRKEEKLMLQMHQDICQSDPSNIQNNQEINFYQRKLQMAQHAHARKLVDLRKMQKEQNQEKAAIIAIKQVKEETEKKRQQRIAFHENYKKQVELFDEKARTMSELHKKEEEKSTELVKTRRKHKHKHWHHRSPKEETNPEKPLITFKTEVEKVDTLHIGEDGN